MWHRFMLRYAGWLERMAAKIRARHTMPQAAEPRE